MKPQDLITEGAKPAYASMNALQKAAAMNAASVAKTRRVPIEEVQQYLQDKSLLVDIDEHAKGAIADAGVKAARAAMSLLKYKSITVDVNKASFATGMGALVANISAMTAEDKDAIIALGTYQVTPASEIGWGGMTDSLLSDWITKVGA